MTLVVASLAGFLAAMLAPTLWHSSQRLTDWLVPAVPFCLTIYFASLISKVTAGESMTAQVAWVPALDISLAFSVDGLSLLFALLITSIGTLVMLYSASYLAGREDRGRFYALILLFMSSMLGLVLSDNLIALIIFWELTTVSSYFLIGFEHQEEEARSSAWTALIVTGIGGQALLAGLVLLGIASDSWSISEIVGRGGTITDHDLYLPILLLISLGAFTKSAQVPFHFWLPSGMVAPTPVSAYLHSATMVKAGVYILARLHPALGDTSAWLYLLSTVGGVTMVVAAFLAFQQHDLKRILAYATISVLGTLVMLLGLGSRLAIEAAMVMLVAHSFYKGALFLVTGSIDHATGTRDVRMLGGLGRAMPITAAAAILAAASLAGLAPFGGFISKELLYDATLHDDFASGALTTAAGIAKALLVAIAAIIVLRPFFGTPSGANDVPHEPPFRMWIGPIVLAGAGLVIGLAPGTTIELIVAQSAGDIVGTPVTVDLRLWHGVNPPLLLSGLTIAAGISGYLFRGAIRRLGAQVEPLGEWGPARFYERSIQGLNWVAVTQTRILQSGYLRYYLLTIIATLTLLIGASLVIGVGIQAPDYPSDIRIYELAVAAGIVFGAVIAIRTESRLGALVALGVIGYSIALVYLLFGATDLAIVQILVEALTIILFILMFYHLPGFATLSSRANRVRDAIASISAGILITVLILISLDVRYAPSISTFYVRELSANEHRANVINAIISDFRSLDTLGESVVLALAGVGVYALLKLRLEGPEPPSGSVVDEQRVESLIFSRTVRYLMPLMLLFSVFLFLRGPQAAGGGFSGGIVAASSLVLYSIARGIDRAREAIPMSHQFVMGAGLLLMLTAGLLPLIFGQPFLTAQIWHTLDISGIGALEIGTPFVFEAGIYLVVLGVTLMIIFSIGEE